MNDYWMKPPSFAAWKSGIQDMLWEQQFFGERTEETYAYNFHEMFPSSAILARNAALDAEDARRGAVRHELGRQAQSGSGPWSTAIGLTANWAFGTGADNPTFINDAVANSFRDARVVNQARDYWYNQVNAGKKNTYEGVTNFLGRKAWTGGNFGFKGLIAAGLDPMEQFVGSFTPTIRSDGHNLTFTIKNTTSFRSLMYGIAPDWFRSTWRPGGNITQTYIFTEPINFNRFKK